MLKHLLIEDINKYLNGQMKPTELLKADDHLAVCDECFQQIADLGVARKAAEFDFLRSSPEESEHLSYEQLKDYVNENPDDIEREMTDVHLQVCLDCRRDLDGLFEMRKLIEADLESETLPPPVIEISNSTQIWNFLFGKYPWRRGFAALGILLSVSLIGLYWFFNRQKPNEIVLTTSPANINQPQNNQNPNNILPTNIEPNNQAQQNTNAETNLPGNSPGPSRTESIPPRYEEEMKRVLADGNLNIPAEIKQLNQATGKLMSGGTADIPFALSSPIGKFIQTNRPRFRWRELSGATGYIVQIFDTNYNQVATSPELSANHWQIDKPLAPNKMYLWQVTAIKDGKEIKSPVRPAPDAKFKVLDSVKARELEQAKRQSGNSPLLLGILYAKAGLLEEAAREFQREINKNPKSEIARKLLRQVRSKR